MFFSDFSLFLLDHVDFLVFCFPQVDVEHLVVLLKGMDDELGLGVDVKKLALDYLLEVVLLLDDFPEAEDVLVLHDFLLLQDHLVLQRNRHFEVEDEFSDLLLDHRVLLAPAHVHDADHFVLVYQVPVHALKKAVADVLLVFRVYHFELFEDVDQVLYFFEVVDQKLVVAVLQSELVLIKAELLCLLQNLADFVIELPDDLVVFGFEVCLFVE